MHFTLGLYVYILADSCGDIAILIQKALRPRLEFNQRRILPPL
jgi:hypothetical protein